MTYLLENLILLCKLFCRYRGGFRLSISAGSWHSNGSHSWLLLHCNWSLRKVWFIKSLQSRSLLDNYFECRFSWCCKKYSIKCWNYYGEPLNFPLFGRKVHHLVLNLFCKPLSSSSLVQIWKFSTLKRCSNWLRAILALQKLHKVHPLHVCVMWSPHWVVDYRYSLQSNNETQL